MLKMLGLIFSLLLCTPLLAQEFTYIELKPALTQKVAQEMSLIKALNTEDDDEDIPFDDVPLFNRIRSRLEGSYSSIGENQANSILTYNNSFDLGRSNFLGLTWQKPFGTFGIGVSRNLVPDITSENTWIVHDELAVSIDATTFLKQMESEGLISFKGGNISAFAGVSFRRVYRFVHYADSYVEGLFSDFSKLFLSFGYFNSRSVLGLEPYNLLSKEDYFSAEAGALVTTPSFYGLSAGIGGLAGFHRISKLQIQRLGDDDLRSEDEFLRISYEKEKGATAGVSARAVLDFYNILKLTLLSYDLEYQYASSDQLNLSFKERDIPNLEGGPLNKQLKRILRMFKPDTEVLRPYIVSREDRRRENLTSRYLVLLWGGVKSRETEHVQIIRDGIEKNFFRHYVQRIKYVKSWWKTLVNGVISIISAFTGWSLDATEASKSRTMVFEYQDELPQNGDRTPSSRNVSVDPERMTINFHQEYTAKKTHGWFKKPYLKQAKHFVKYYTTLPYNIYSAVKKKKVRGPIQIYTDVRISREGINHLNGHTIHSLWYLFAYMCDLSKKNLRKRKHNSCTWNLERKWNKYRSSLDQSKEIQLGALKDFLDYFFKKNDRLDQVQYLFGRPYVFVSGSLMGTLEDKTPYQTFFQGGQFNGMGIIEDYRAGRITFD